MDTDGPGDPGARVAQAPRGALREGGVRRLPRGAAPTDPHPYPGPRHTALPPGLWKSVSPPWSQVVPGYCTLRGR